MGATTLWVPPELRDRLSERKAHPRQPFHEVISHLIDLADGGAAPQRGGLDRLVARHREQLLAAAKDNGIDRLWLFGSRARGDAGPDSDVDLIYEAERGKSLWDICGFILDAQDILGLKVDLVDRLAMDDAFRDRVAPEAVPL